MYDVLPASVQQLCNQAPVTTPPKRLRGHDAGSGLGQGLGERRLPPLSTHAGGITAEGGNAEAAEAILIRITGATTTKLDRMPITDPAIL